MYFKFKLNLKRLIQQYSADKTFRKRKILWFVYFTLIQQYLQSGNSLFQNFFLDSSVGLCPILSYATHWIKPNQIRFRKRELNASNNRSFMSEFISSEYDLTALVFCIFLGNGWIYFLVHAIFVASKLWIWQHFRKHNQIWLVKD